MYFLFGEKIYSKDRFAALLSFLAGFVFFVGNLVYFFGHFSLETFFSLFSRITFQSNLFAFIVSGFYYFKPTHKMFASNFFILFACILLWFAGLGFWAVLFPIYYIDLGDYLISSQEQDWYAFALFFAIWNHAVTQVCFLFFFFFCLKKQSGDSFLTPVPIKTMLFSVYTYLFLWVIWNAFMSVWDKVFPTYGILTNFNPYSKFKTSGAINQTLFSLKFLIASHFACLILMFLLTIVFSSVAIKYAVHNYYQIHKRVPSNLVKPIKGFI